jgi:hypothetical protein
MKNITQDRIKMVKAAARSDLNSGSGKKSLHIKENRIIFYDHLLEIV